MTFDSLRSIRARLLIQHCVLFIQLHSAPRGGIERFAYPSFLLQSPRHPIAILKRLLCETVTHKHAQPAFNTGVRLPDNGLNLEERVQWKARNLHRRARRLMVPEELGVDRVDGLEVVHRLQEHLYVETIRGTLASVC